MVLPYTRWQALDSTTLVCRSWERDDERAVFNEASGDLHLLNGAAVAVLTALQATPLSLEELAAQFPDVETSALEALVESLDLLGLVQPVYL